MCWFYQECIFEHMTYNIFSGPLRRHLTPSLSPKVDVLEPPLDLAEV